MIKRLVWTIILLSPAVVAGFMSIIGGDGDASDIFNAGAAVDWTWKTIIDFTNLFKKDSDTSFWTFLWHLIVAAFFIAPYIFVWRGLFFIEWIPKIGHAFRAITLAFIIFIPGIMQVISNSGNSSEFLGQFGIYFNTAVIALSLIGLWLPKFITTKK